MQEQFRYHYCMSPLKELKKKEGHTELTSYTAWISVALHIG